MPFCVPPRGEARIAELFLLRNEARRDNLARRETFSPLHPLQTSMRARVVWLEISLILVALAFAELGEVLRELRTESCSTDSFLWPL